MRILRKIALILVACIMCTVLMPTMHSTAQTSLVQVTASDGLNVRTGPGMGYPVVRVLEYGSVWYIYGYSGNWLKLGTNRWVYSSYVKQAEPIKTVVTTAKSGLNVRKGPGTSYSIVRVLPLNSKVSVIEQKNGWYKISNDEWISAAYTKLYTGLDNTTLGWYYIPNTNHTVPVVDDSIDISKYDAYYVGVTESKSLYLTFDLGYEGGYTGSILDTLNYNNVKATFFVTKSYIEDNAELVERMVNEGHIVGNHTNTHPSLPSISEDVEKFNGEILSVETAYKNLTGKDMMKIMRPPMGEYSELSLYRTKQLGYKTIFWSFAYYDYDTENQPDKAAAFNKITAGTHNGAIMLLHGVSKTNTEILDSVIKNIKEQGYSFATLAELP